MQAQKKVTENGIKTSLLFGIKERERKRDIKMPGNDIRKEKLRV